MKGINKDRCLSTAKVGEKGQIVIPKEVREMFGIQAGDSLILLADINRGIAIAKYDDYFNFAQTIFDARDEQK